MHLLFVCIENSNRSQMAEAFAHMLGDESIHAFSAGSRPSGQINPKAVSAMQELGYDLTTHSSKSLDEIPDIEYDYVITMGCGDACPWVRARYREDWEIPDPRDLNEDHFRHIRDQIRMRVNSLLQNLNFD